MRTYPQICFRNKQTNKQNETKEKKTKAKTKVGGKVPKQSSFRAKWGQFSCNLIGWPNSQVQNLIS